MSTGSSLLYSWVVKLSAQIISLYINKTPFTRHESGQIFERQIALQSVTEFARFRVNLFAHVKHSSVETFVPTRVKGA